MFIYISLRTIRLPFCVSAQAHNSSTYSFVLAEPHDALRHSSITRTTARVREWGLVAVGQTGKDSNVYLLCRCVNDVFA
jgi:hypothetical protein